MLLSLGAMLLTSAMVSAVPTHNMLAKYGCLALFNTSVAFAICPLVVLGGPLLLRAAAVTGGVVGSLALVAANSPSEQFLWMAGPLAMGLGAVVISSLGAAFLPSAAAATVLHKVSLYGGLVVFSGFMLYDTSRLVDHAKHKPSFDPVVESINIYMDAVNLYVGAGEAPRPKQQTSSDPSLSCVWVCRFVRIAQMMAGSNNRR